MCAIIFSMRGIFTISDTLEGNILKYALGLMLRKRMFAAIIGAYYLTIPGVNTWWVGVALFSSSIASFIFEVPSGYLSDKMGHKRALVFSAFCMFASSTLFLFANSIFTIISAGILMSIGNAFFSGTGNAFMHETLRALNRENEFREIMGKVTSIGFFIPAVFVVFIPFLVSISWKLPFLISVLFDLVGICMMLKLKTPPVTKEHIEEVNTKNFRQVIKEGRRFQFFRFALFTAILSGVIFAVSGFRGTYQDILGIPVEWYGIFFGIGRILASVILWFSGSIQRFFKGRYTYLYLTELIIFAVLILLLGVSTDPYLIVPVFILINAFQWGLSGIGYNIETISRSKFKATLLSVQGQIQEITVALTAVLLGFLAHTYSFTTSYLVVVGILIIILLPILFLISKYQPIKV